MKRNEDLEATIVGKFSVMAPLLDERTRRLWAAAESVAIGYGGDALVSAATGLARETIRTGRRELARGVEATTRIRRAGAGRPGIGKTQPGLKAALESLVEPLTRGDPRSPLRWTCKSRAKLTAALTAAGWRVSSTTVGRLLHELGYRLQSVRKSREGTSHPDRNAQFEHINTMAAAFLRRRQPVISVDTKKKELVGNFKNAGQEWQPAGTPEPVRVHDFPGDAVGKAIPYGVYDMARNDAWVITADAGGSNGYRSRAWKQELQRLADDLRLRIHVSHFPPGTSKWNKIEHRLFCHITENWRGRVLHTFETVVALIGHTRTAAGLRVKAKLDTRRYPTGQVVTHAEMRALALHPDAFHGDWNYELRPRPS